MAIYCIDTSALLDAWVRWYPPDLFPSLWTRIEDLITDGSIIAPEDVLYELERKDDDLSSWARKHRNMFHALDEPLQAATNEILSGFPKLVESRKERSGADPFVIALARITGAAVVTGEKNTGTADRPKIPNVCDAFAIRWISIVSLIREERWIF